MDPPSPRPASGRPRRARYAYRVCGALLLASLAAIFVAGEIFLPPALGFMADGMVVPMLLVAAWYFGMSATLATWAGALAFDLYAEARLRNALTLEAALYSALMGLLIAFALALLVKLRDRVSDQRSELAASEARFRLLTEASFEGIVVHDDGLILEVNAALAKMFGYTGRELRGKSVLDLTDPEDAARVQGAIDRGETGPREYVGRRRDGRPFDMEVLARYIEIDGRRVRVTAVRDVTRRRQEEIVLRRNERLAALGTLVAGIAHEMNNPLTYIRGNIELVALDAQDLGAEPTPENARLKAASIVENSMVALQGIERLGSLAQGLRRVARPTTHARKPVDVNAVVEQMLPLIRARASPTTTIARDARSTQLVHANEDEITQILLNLSLNALDAIATHGECIDLVTHDEGENVVVEVRDNGPGIADADRPRIFTPFFTTKAQGTGLGLSISHAIAVDLGGRLTFSTSEGQGTTFRLSIPILRTPPRDEGTA